MDVLARYIEVLEDRHRMYLEVTERLLDRIGELEERIEKLERDKDAE